MTTPAQITKKADIEGVTAAVVERDYVLAHVVALISSLDKESVLVFKGGTSLRLVYLEDCRYSADLDYSVVGATEDEALNIISSALLTSKLESIPHLSLTDSRPARIVYRGPLAKERQLKLDLAADELVVNTEKRALIPRWDDVPAISVRAYTPLEIAGEKLRCVLQRLQCRDLLDLNVLFDEMDVDPTEAARLYAHKATHRGLDPSAFAPKFENRLPEYRRRWQPELSQYLVGELPHFEDFERRIRRFLRDAKLI